MRDHLTRQWFARADEAWQTIDRHLFADSSALPWCAADRLVVGFHPDSGSGALTHKTARAWETYGGRTSTGISAPTGAAVHGSVSTAWALRPAGGHLRSGPAGPTARAGQATSGSWWDHDGALAWCSPACRPATWCCRCAYPRRRSVGPPVSFPGRSQYLAQDRLVRVRDRKPPAWRYYAHLLFHHRGYQSAATGLAAPDPTDRRAGVDANVSNLSSRRFPQTRPGRW